MDNKLLVPNEALTQIDKLEDKLSKLLKSLTALSGEADEVFKTFSKGSTSLKELSTAIDRYTKVENEVTALEKERIKVRNEIERQQAKLSVANSEEAKELERLRQLNRDAVTLNRNVVKARNSEEGSVVQLRAQLNKLNFDYDRLNKATRESAFGQQMQKNIQNLTKEVTELEKATGRNQRGVGGYEEAIRKALGSLPAPINGAINSFRELRQSGSSVFTSLGGALQVFGGNLLTKAADGIIKITSAAKEFISVGVDIAAKAEGIQRAFDKLNNPDLLKNLRSETKGLVSDLTLMQTAVRAENFDIPLNDLGSLLKFAQQRAQETGESVDYLENSIINGIGRKSTPILDNLGLTASRLKDAAAETGDFTTGVIKIVNEELEKQGDLALTAADKQTQAAVKWENAQLRIGQRFSSLGDIWSRISGEIADGISRLAGDTRNATQVYDDQIVKVAELERTTSGLIDEYDSLSSKTNLTLKEQQRLREVANQISEEIPGVTTAFDRYGNALEISSDKAREFIEQQQSMLEYIHQDAIAQTEKDVESLQKKIENLQKQQETGIVVGLFGGFRKANEDDIKAIDVQISQTNVLLDGARKYLARLTGQTTEDAKNAQKDILDQRDRFNKLTKTQLEAEINLKRATVETLARIYEIQKQIEGNAATDITDNMESALNRAKAALDQAQGIFNQRFGSITTDTGGSKTKTKDDTAKKNLEAELKAQREIDLLEIKQEADKQKKILDDNTEAFWKREKALYLFIEEQEAAINTARDHQLADLQKEFKTEEEFRDKARVRIEAIEKKAAAEIKKIREEGEKLSKDITKDYAEEQLKVISDALNERTQAIKESEQKNMEELARQYSEGIITSEQYEAKRKETAIEAQNEIFENEIKFLQEQLDVNKLTAEQKEKLEEQLAKARIDYAKFASDTIVSFEEEAAKKREEIEKSLADKRKELISESLDFIGELFSAFYAKQQKDLEKQGEQIDKEYEKQQKDSERRTEKEIEDVYAREQAGLITEEEAAAERIKIQEDEDARLAAIDQIKQVREEELQRKQQELAKQQARVEMASALAKVAVDTAQKIAQIKATIAAITAAAALNPALIPSIGIASAQIPLVIASGAIAAATIAAQQVSAYAKGTDDAKGGLSIVGDGGRSELIVTPQGGMYKTPDIPTLVNLPAHTIVKPDFEKALTDVSMMANIKPYVEPKTIVVQENKNQLKELKETKKMIGKLLIGQGRERGNQGYMIAQNRVGNIKNKRF